MNPGMEQRTQSILKNVTNVPFRMFFSDVFQGLYCMLTSEITLETTLLSSTMLSLLKQDKQFQYYDCRAWQLYPALLNLILAFTK